MAKVGSKAGWNGNFVESVSEAKTLTMGDSGKAYLVTASAAYQVTLPTAPIAGAGASYKFLVNAALDGTLGYDVTFSDGESDIMVTHYVDGNNDVVYDADADTAAIVPMIASLELGSTVIKTASSSPLLTNVYLTPALVAGNVIVNASVPTRKTFPLSL